MIRRFPICILIAISFAAAAPAAEDSDLAALLASFKNANERLKEESSNGSYRDLLGESISELRESADALSPPSGCPENVTTAEPPSTALSRQFCRSPATFTCPESREEGIMSQLIELLARKIRKEARSRAASRLKMPDKGLSLGRACGGKLEDRSCREAFDAYARALDEVMSEEISSADMDSTARSAAAETRGMILGSIDKMENAGTIGARDAGRLREGLDRIRVLTLSDLPNLEEPERAAAMESFFSFCGPGGTYRNAFMTDASSKSRLIMVCPGEFIASAGRTKRELESKLVGLYAHQMGHGLGYDTSFYGPFLKCLREKAPELLGQEDGAEETVANLWAEQVQLRRMEANEPLLTGEAGRKAAGIFLPATGSLDQSAQRILDYRLDWGTFCADQGSDASARLDATMMMDPTFRKYMGCSRLERNTEGAASCSFPR